jgi:hypothetical protein
VLTTPHGGLVTIGGVFALYFSSSQPQHPKTSPLAQSIGAVESDAQALDSNRY